ncbi:MAG: hypothetical protein IKT46_07095 [Clostridia bacterium]|nr:hypothetical protein [Clostridia bacterium]
MKRIFAALMCVLMFAVLLVPVMAEEDNFLAEIGEIPCPYATPTVDGNIDASEGWSSAQYIDKTNTDGAWGGEDVVITGNIYRAYDDKNLYIAADIVIPELSLSEGEDWIEGAGEDGNRPGWDGDVFVYTLDPLGEMINNGFISDPGVWYCFGIFEGNNIRVYRTHVNDAEVTDTVKAEGSVTDGGWRFEAAIPWETICKDVEDISYGDIVLTPADIVKEGSVIKGEMLYYDRVYDAEATERITGSRYATICMTCVDGTPGTSATPWMLKAYGMHFVLGAKATADTTTDTTDEATEAVTDEKGNTVTDDKGNKVTQKATAKTTTKKATTGTSTGGNAAQTLDMGIAMAIGALAVSGIGLAVSKKRR